MSPAGLAAALAGRRSWLLDLDGTLVHSGPVHATAFRTAIAELAPDRLELFHYDTQAGASTRSVVAGLGVDAATRDRLIRRKQELYRGYVDAGRVATCRGTVPLLDRLAGLGQRAYLVTSGSRDSVRRVLAANGLTDRFTGVLTSDDLPASKPDPDVYRLACRRWSLDPAAAVVVEDSAHGTLAALGAGLLTVQVHLDGADAETGAVPAACLRDLVSLLGSPASDD